MNIYSMIIFSVCLSVIASLLMDVLVLALRYKDQRNANPSNNLLHYVSLIDIFRFFISSNGRNPVFYFWSTLIPPLSLILYFLENKGDLEPPKGFRNSIDQTCPAGLGKRVKIGTCRVRSPRRVRKEVGLVRAQQGQSPLQGLEIKTYPLLYFKKNQK